MRCEGELRELFDRIAELEDAYQYTWFGDARDTIKVKMMHVLSTIAEIADANRCKIKAEGFSV